MIIDAKDMILGRLASYAAHQALLGEKIDIVNCDLACVSGKREVIFKAYLRRYKMGTFKGPFYHRSPDRFVRRTIRGMLPYKQDKGKTAYMNIMCWNGIPIAFKDKKMETIPGAKKDKLPLGKFVTIKEISQFLGGKI
jgi:large subunit ribosomal protein L13